LKRADPIPCKARNFKFHVCFSKVGELIEFQNWQFEATSNSSSKERELNLSNHKCHPITLV